MKLMVLISTLAGLLTAPALGAALAPDAAPDLATVTALETRVISVEASAAGEADLRVVVHHLGADAPALFTITSDDSRFAFAVMLEEGENVLFERALLATKYKITLQNLVTAGAMSVDLRKCAEGVTQANMTTTFRLTQFGIKVGPSECIASQD